MIRFAVVEDNINDANLLISCLNLYSKKNNIEFDITHFLSGNLFLEAYRHNFDIVFMDIEMNGFNGIETSKCLRAIDNEIILIFVTNMVQYVLEGYQVDALDFVIKPVSSEAISIKINRALNRIPRREKSLLIKTNKRTITLSFDDICYIESQGHYVYYHTTSETFIEYGTMKELNKILPTETFVYANRCFIINLNYVKAIEKDEVIIGKDRLLISRGQRKSFLRALADYYGGRKK